MPLRRRVTDLSALELLVRVAELGSLTRAAAAQGISQPTASAALDRLERRLGVTLLRRNHSGSAPTEVGGRVVELARRVLASADELEGLVEVLRGEASSHLRLAASYTIAEYLLPVWLTAWQRTAPRPAVRLAVHNSADVKAKVLADEADLGFVEGSEVGAGLDGCALGQDELTLVVAPCHPWADRDAPVPAVELARTPLVARERGSGTREVVEARLAPCADGPLPEPLLELGSTTAVKGAVLDGAGPALLGSPTVRDDVASGRLRAVAVTGVDLRRTLWVVWRAGNPLGAAAQSLIRHAIAHPG